MAGTWVAQNKVRPGAYINVEGNGQPQISSALGRLLMLSDLELGWGKKGVIPLTTATDFNKYLGTTLDDPKLLMVQEALKGAEVVLFVNTNDGTKATVQPKGTPWTFTAKYPGTKGNDISISIENDPDNSNLVTVSTLFGTKVVDQQSLFKDKLDQLEANGYVDVDYTAPAAPKEGEEAAAPVLSNQNVKLAGGTTKQANLADLMNEALENETYTVVTTAGMAIDSNIHSLLFKAIKRMREDEGKRIRAVVPFTGQNYDYEGISVVANGYILEDGTKVNTTNATARFAGLSASADADTALTYTELADANKADPQLDNNETIEALNLGKIVYTTRAGNHVVVEWDINSFTKFSPDKQKSFHKNRVVRTIDEVYTDTKNTFEQSFLGKVSNNAEGRDLFRANRISYLTELQSKNIIQNFKNSDVEVLAGEDSDSVVVNLWITPVDSMEKLYVTMTVR